MKKTLNQVKKKIEKKEWLSRFTLIGEAVTNKDYTFTIDEQSKNSAWIFNQMNIGTFCGEKFGTIYASMMGGYSTEGDSVIYAHGKKDDGTDDFDTQIQIPWEDRLNPDVLEDVGDLCFITVGLERTDKGSTFYEKFLSAYDAIAYIKEHIENGMVINVKGTLKYQLYNDNTTVQKNITSIVLSKAEKENYKAEFVQTVLLNSDSVSLKNIDKDKNVVYVDTRVLDYAKEINGVEVKGQYSYSKTFEFEMDFTKPDVCTKIIDKVFKVKKDVTQITFTGEFIEGESLATVTWDDVPEDIKELVELGIYSEEEAIASCSATSTKERRMVLKKPYVKLIGDDKKPEIQKFERRYTEDDLYLDYIYNNDKTDDVVDSVLDEDGNADLDWLKALED